MIGTPPILRLLAGLCLAALSLSPGLAIHGSAQSKDRTTWAVVIGISRYPKLPGGLQLQFPEKDATEFAAALVRTGIPERNIKLLVGSDATSSEIKSAIGNWLARTASPSDAVIFYFSGHGFVESGFSEAYLLAYDSTIDNPYATAISTRELGHALGNRVRAETVLLLADAVRRDFFDPDGDGPRLSEMFAQAVEDIAAARHGISAFLSNSPGQFSREGQRWGGHGVFTRHLLDAMDGATGADLAEVFTFVSTRVAADTSGRQQPWRTSTPLPELALGRGLPRVTPGQPEPSARPEERTGEISPIEIARTPRVEPPPPTAERSDAAPRQATPPDSPAESRVPVAPPTPATQPEPGPAPDPVPTVRTPSVRPEQREPTRETPATPVQPPPRVTTPEQRVEPDATPSRPGQPEPTREPPAAPVVPPPVRTPVPRVEPDVMPSRPEPPEPGPEAPVSPVQPPPEPRTPLPPTGLPPVNPTPTPREGEPEVASLPVAPIPPGPSPLPAEFDMALARGLLIEPAGSSAWDLFQQLQRIDSSSSRLPRMRARLIDSLIEGSRALLSGDIRIDRISDLVDDFRRAGQMLSRAKALGSNQGESAGLERLSAAQALVALQFYDEAEKSLLQLRSLNLAAVENSLGIVFAGQFDRWRAERAFRRAAELDPNWAAPLYNLGKVTKTTDPESSLAALERASALDPENPAILLTLGDEYFERERWAEAAETYQRAVELRPADDTLRTKLGHALYSQGRRDEANREYQKAAELRGRRR